MTEVIIDFEGCRRKGIRQIGIIQSQNLRIINTWDVDIVHQKDISTTLMEALTNSPSVMIAHNVQIEKNLLREYMPYHRLGNNNGRLSWGPWLDTKEVYGVLYPKIKNYTLESLTKSFIPKKELDKKTSDYCETEKRKPHCALYDALCTYMLIKRIAQVIDLAKFAKD
ncbi:MAG: hypothetical protein HOI70_12045 [Opitutae bacterium]|jgi:DNA polymerase III epsilon subunit-like protein|nr:hypothetical protein [Opitutae bacterium]